MSLDKDLEAMDKILDGITVFSELQANGGVRTETRGREDARVKLSNLLLQARLKEIQDLYDEVGEILAAADIKNDGWQEGWKEGYNEVSETIKTRLQSLQSSMEGSKDV